jgi:hypothetical protein
MNKETEWKKQQEKEMKRIEKTDSYKKLLSYLERVSEEDSFQRKVSSIRKLCGLPSSGLNKYLQFNHNGKKITYYPESLDTDEAIVAINDFTVNLGLTYDWGDLIQHYIVYNNFELKNMWAQPIVISDVMADIEGPFEYEGEKESNIKAILELLKAHPVVVFIDPYTPERDIVDYVKKLYKTEIKPIQDKYKNTRVKRGKLRKKNKKVSLRDKYIRENYGLMSMKELKIKIEELFDCSMDDSYIRRIAGGGRKNVTGHR